jgi:hypothetical protein
VTKPAEADDADLLALADVPPLQRRVSRDPRAEQRRRRGVIKPRGHAQHKLLIDDDALRVAAECVAAGVFIFAVVGKRRAVAAELLEAFLAVRAGVAGIHQATNRRDVARAEVLHAVADACDAADNFVTGNARVVRFTPFAARRVQVGMANAAEEDLICTSVAVGSRRSIESGRSVSLWLWRRKL